MELEYERQTGNDMLSLKTSPQDYFLDGRVAFSSMIID